MSDPASAAHAAHAVHAAATAASTSGGHVHRTLFLGGPVSSLVAIVGSVVFFFASVTQIVQPGAITKTTVTELVGGEDRLKLAVGMPQAPAGDSNLGSSPAVPLAPSGPTVPVTITNTSPAPAAINWNAMMATIVSGIGIAYGCLSQLRAYRDKAKDEKIDALQKDMADDRAMRDKDRVDWAEDRKLWDVERSTLTQQVGGLTSRVQSIEVEKRSTLESYDKMMVRFSDVCARLMTSTKDMLIAQGKLASTPDLVNDAGEIVIDDVTPEYKGRMLIVEDNAYARDGMSNYFHLLGWDVTTATTVTEGLNGLGGKPDVVMLDLMLPDGEGTQILGRIRQQKLPIRVIVTTGMDDGLLGPVRALGPDALFRKPVHPVVLRRAVEDKSPNGTSTIMASAGGGGDNAGTTVASAPTISSAPTPAAPPLATPATGGV